MQNRHALLITNLIAVPVLLIALIAGWLDAAGFGLAVLVLMDILVLVRERRQAPARNQKGDSTPSTRVDDDMNVELPEITYDQAKAAYESGQKLHDGDRVWLVRPVLRDPGAGTVFWIADERTRGDHGYLLHPDGRVESR